MGRQNRDFAVDLLRGFGIILMIFGHVHTCRRFDIWIHGFHMPLFFIISGYMFSPEISSFTAFIKRKFTRLIVPYIGFTVVNFLFCFIFIPKDRIDIFQKFFHFLFRPNVGQISAGTAVWFLPALFWTVLFFYIIVRLCHDRIFLVLPLSLLAGLFGTWLPQSGIFLPLTLSHGLTGVAFCGTGYGLRRFYLRYGEHIPKSSGKVFFQILISIILLFLFYRLIRFNHMVNFRTENYQNVFLTFFNAVGTAVLLWSIAVSVENIVMKNNVLKIISKPLSQVGANTMLYLCLNQMIILVLYKLILHGVKQYNRLWDIFIGLVTVAVCYILVLLKKHTWKFTVKQTLGIVLSLLVVFMVTVTVCGKQYRITDIISVDQKYDEDISLLRIRDMMNENLKYALNTWWNELKPYSFSKDSNIRGSKKLTPEQMILAEESQKTFIHWKEQDYLLINLNKDIKRAEQGIRPLGHLCYMLAVAIRFDYYDEKIVGISASDAEKMLFLLMRTGAKMHKDGKWGNTWQSALWAENIGFAGYLLWDELSAEDRELITEMVLGEADTILNRYDIPYYKDRSGNVVYKGDTKGEEIAWNSKILALAVCMYPEHPDVSRWQDKLIKMLIASTAAPSSLSDKRNIDGIIPSDFLNGSNINTDGTVINHNRCHLDYMTTIVQEMADTEVLFKIAGLPSLEAATYNVDKIYNAMVNVDLGSYDRDKAGHHFYERDFWGRPTAGLNMPGKSDWGGKWYASCYLTDVYANVMGMDPMLPEKSSASQWQKVHFIQLEKMMRRNPDGNFFVDGENNFVSGEFFQMHNVTKAYLLQILKKHE